MNTRGTRLVVVVTLASLTCAVSRAAQRMSDLQSRFDHEANSVHKAKLFEKLGDEEFAETRRASQANDFNTVGQVMEKYRDNARAAMSALKKDHPDAGRQMGGYKQLQMHIHRGLRELDETLVVAPAEFRPPLQLVRQDLVSMDDELLILLFPRRAEPKKTEAPSASNPPEESNVKAKDCLAVSVLACTVLTGSSQPSAAAPQPAGASAPEAGSSQPDSESSSSTDSALAAPEGVSPKAGAAPSQPEAPSGEPGTTSHRPPPQQQKDYLSGLEADKIRDAENTNERIKLFLAFADDRLKKFQYELQHPSSNKHPEMLNALMNGYVGCVDDAADLIQHGIEKQDNIRQGVDLMATKTKEFLDALNKIAADKVEIEIYKDNLDDAIEGTRDAMNEAEKAKKNVAPPPVRRKN